MYKPITITLGRDGEIKDVDFAQWIMNEIEDKIYTRKEVAHTYAILIGKGHKDFTEINKAIMNRWSESGLQWVKTQAWKRIEGHDNQRRG